MNPANYTPFVDGDGGEWIRFTGTQFKGVVWRPTDIDMTDDGQISFALETLEGEGFPVVSAEDWQAFGKTAGSILTEVLASEAAELETMAEAYQAQEDAKDELVDENGNPLLS